MNQDPGLLYWVDEVIVFGSYLSDSETLGDIDCFQHADRFRDRLSSDPNISPVVENALLGSFLEVYKL